MRAAKTRAISRAWRDGDYLGTGAGNVIVGGGRHSSTKRCMHVRKRMVVSRLDILDSISDAACRLPPCTPASSNLAEVRKQQKRSSSAELALRMTEAGLVATVRKRGER
jgi:hypothetical protein